MNLFAQEASAPAAQGQAGGGYMTIIMMVAIFAIFYFLLIRPQQKRQKQLQMQIQQMKKGDEVVTAGGIKGKILDIDGDTVKLESAGTQVEVMKSHIGQVLAKK